MIDRAIQHIKSTAKVPSFSSYEERLHPYIRSVISNVPQATEIEVLGNNLIWQIGNNNDQPTVALAAHLDKINHYGNDYPEELPVKVTNEYIKGAMDDCAGLGMLLTLAEKASKHNWPNLLLFFSEMEESKGLKEHPELLRNNGDGYTHGMGAKRIARQCVEENLIPEQVITLDTTPLFKGKQGIALYSKHWEYNDLDPSDALIESTEKAVGHFISIDARIKIDNNTNDYLHYGEVFNQSREQSVVSVALEPAIYPYHQKGERVFTDDIERCLNIISEYLDSFTA
ncbi:M28 family peptidase [Fodinibius halophilus]|uniref:Succinyl-diaminopimelate desuccinylase n=1 Tax=Fodinibius halophilus TaxID=1736908 RepID=A0A6M1T900_9BACT|nr:M28 family peptidase [Fodinibius halophilus]NGP89053.1 succinyl-diaminopimelate desuccinylase [Fodinibius halophilus]